MHLFYSSSNLIWLMICFCQAPKELYLCNGILFFFPHSAEMESFSAVFFRLSSYGVLIPFYCLFLHRYSSSGIFTFILLFSGVFSESFAARPEWSSFSGIAVSKFPMMAKRCSQCRKKAGTEGGNSCPNKN